MDGRFSVCVDIEGDEKVFEAEVKDTVKVGS
jgi:hypothetical protein